MKSSCLLFCFALCFSLAAFEEQGRQLSTSFAAQVEPDRAQVRGLIPRANDVVAAWLCEKGQAVRLGDPVIIWDTRILRDKLAVARYDLAISTDRRRRDELRLENELQAMLEQQAQKQAQLAVSQARLERLRIGDRHLLPLRRLQFEAAKNRVTAQRERFESQQALAALGQVTEDAVDQARHSWQQALVSLLEPEAAMNQAASHLDKNAIAWEMLRADKLQLELGISADGRSGDFGLAKQVKGLRQRIRRELAKADAELERVQRQVHDLTKDAHDHTPVRSLTIINLADGSTHKRIVFQPDGFPVPDGTVVDHGLVFGLDCGFGWDQDQQARMHWREGKVQAPAAPSHRRGKRGGRSKRAPMSAAGVPKIRPSRQASPVVAEPVPFGIHLATKQASWRCQLPAGHWQFQFTIGDEIEWHGSFIAVQGDCISWVPEVPAGSQVVETQLQTQGEDVVVTFGVPEPKAMRALGNGFAEPQTWMSVGRRGRRGGWPYAYFTGAGSLELQAIVHEDIAGFLRASKEPLPLADDATTLDRLRSDLSQHVVQVETGDGMYFDATVVAVGQQPVALHQEKANWWDDRQDDKKDRSGREVRLRLPTADIKRLRSQERLRCSVQMTIPAGITSIPGHLVSVVDRQTVVWAKGEPVPFSGVRFGNDWATRDTLPTDLHEPATDQVSEVAKVEAFEGLVIAGSRHLVQVGSTWGRITDMVADGSDVEEGQVLVRLRNPSIESNKAAQKEAQKRAQQDFLLAMEQRRMKALEVQLEHDQHLIAEREAGVAYQRWQTPADLDLLQKDVALRRARAEASFRQERAVMLIQDSTLARRKRERAGNEAKQAALRAELAEINAIMAKRQANWLQGQSLRADWKEAQQRLDLRESALALGRAEEQQARQASQAQLERSLQGGYQEKEFERYREITAPRSGRLFYLEGWNDHTRTMTKIGPNFAVWWGMGIAEILDMSDLALTVDLPERLYGTTARGDSVEITFSQFDNATIQGRITQIGRDVYIDKDAEDADEKVGIRRVFSVTVSFEPNERLQELLIPGTKGTIRL